MRYHQDVGIAVVLLGAIVVGGCGRIGFDVSGIVTDDAGDVTDDAGDVTDDAGSLTDAANIAIDGSTVTVGFGALTKITAESPLLVAPTDSISCGYYLISGGGRQATSFTHDGRVYFAVPCKYNDSGAGGWHLAIAHWAPGEKSVTWEDGDSQSPGIQEIIARTDLLANGFEIESFSTTTFVQVGTELWGFMHKYFSAADYGTTSQEWVSSSHSGPLSISATDYNLSNPDNISISANDDTWQGAMRNEMGLFHEAGTLYIYNTTVNAPTSDTFYLSVSTTTDMATVTLPTAPIVEGYGRAHVFRVSGDIYMVAFSFTREVWTLFRGTSPTDFDFDTPFDLDLAGAAIGLGGWDDSGTLTNLPSNQPMVTGVEVLGDEVYIFYMAGVLGQATPYDGPRGIGAYRLSLD